MQNNEDENGISNVKSAGNPSNLIRKEEENLFPSEKWHAS